MNEVPRAFEGEQSLSEPNIYVSLTYNAALDATTAMARVKSPKAGAVVLFAGTRTLLDHHDTQTNVHTVS